jgi:GNAT superfamily N-acetyltransferase
VHFREATTGDIGQIQVVRNSVKENVLSDPALVTNEDCEEFLTKRGKGWICEIEKVIVGFAIVDLQEQNIRALFVSPAFENLGIGSRLQEIMLDWFFSQNRGKIWLATGYKTRAEVFYRHSGWREVGLHGTKEIKFEMTYDEWQKAKSQDIKLRFPSKRS